MSWKELAACKGMDQNLFFSSERGRSTKKARAMCAGCIVNEECLNYALTASANPDGIYGGTTVRERRAMRRERQSVA